MLRPRDECIYYVLIYGDIVTGDANFQMGKMAVIVSGFTQPTVAKSLWDQQASIEKGLPQRFLWLIPQPSFSTFELLEPIDETFYDSIGNYFNENR